MLIVLLEVKTKVTTLKLLQAKESPTDGTGEGKPENPYIAPISEEKSSSPDTEVQSKHTATSTTSIEPNEERETMKIETPVTKQTDYHLSYINLLLLPMMGGKNKPSQSEMGKWVPRFSDSSVKKESSTTKKTLWSGGPQPDSQDYNGGNYKDRYKVLAEIRKALEAGDRQKSETVSRRKSSRTKQRSIRTLLIFR